MAVNWEKPEENRRAPDGEDQAPPQFVGIARAVMQGAKCVAVACSHTFAKRIARALNKHVPNKRGV